MIAKLPERSRGRPWGRQRVWILQQHAVGSLELTMNKRVSNDSLLLFYTILHFLSQRKTCVQTAYGFSESTDAWYKTVKIYIFQMACHSECRLNTFKYQKLMENRKLLPMIGSLFTWRVPRPITMYTQWYKYMGLRRCAFNQVIYRCLTGMTCNIVQRIW